METKPEISNKANLAKMIAYSDQIGYRSVVDESGRERLEPVNAALQAIFEAALRKLRLGNW